jgi:hypothetical protein
MDWCHALHPRPYVRACTACGMCPSSLDAVREKYWAAEGFDVSPLQIQGRDALLVRGVMQTPTVSWASALHVLTGETIDLGNSTAAAVLLLRTQSDPQSLGNPVKNDSGEDWSLRWRPPRGYGHVCRCWARPWPRGRRRAADRERPLGGLGGRLWDGISTSRNFQDRSWLRSTDRAPYR